MNAKLLLAGFKDKLDKEIKLYLDDKISMAGEWSPYCRELMEHIANLTLRGGKRIRAALLYYSYIGHGGIDRDEAMRAAMSMELAETYLLIHDDIIDDDAVRRGGPTIHTIYDKVCKSNNFGKSIAVLAGNIACAASNEILANCRFSGKDIVRAIDTMNSVYLIEQYGQTLDLFSEIRTDISSDDILLVHQLKTVPYTFDGPVKIGAILAGASNKQINRLSGYSVPLGTAFQIQDDILGMFGSEDKLGKPVISDLKEGKKTLLIIKALEMATPKQQKIIDTNLGNKTADKDDLEEIKQIIINTGSLEYSKRLAKELVEQSTKNLQQLSLDKEGKDFLLGVADYIINREH